MEYLVVSAAALAVGVVFWLGFSDTRQAPTVSVTTTSVFTESVVVESNPLAAAWELADRAGIECEPDDGANLVLEVCWYEDVWLGIRVFPASDREVIADWAQSMVDQFQSAVLVGNGWGIEHHFPPTPYDYLEEIRAALGEGEIVSSGLDVLMVTSEVPEIPEVVMGGSALDWRWVMDLEEDQSFNAILATELGLWALTEDEDEQSVLWHSADGLVWTELDTATLLGEGAVVSDLVEGGPGIVAVGFRPVDGTQEAVAWTSTGGDWTVSPLGFTIPEGEVSGLDLWHVAAGSSGAVIA
ncbi:MAG: hypothetical protein RI637_10950, partial [Acidimicrobiia bacterium]|nr:hypothetical protein [Acidimicrobiia bacterium]